MGGLGVYCAASEVLQFSTPRISSHLARGEGRFPWHKCRPATTSLKRWDTSSRPPGALGLGHWPRVPRGPYSQLGLYCPPRSLILGGRALV